jgi:hypothetical protein
MCERRRPASGTAIISVVAIERNNTFPLLLSDDELKLLNLLAERDGLDASEYLRSVIRMMPSANAPTIAQVTRLGATLGSLSRAGKVDLAKLFEAHTDAMKATSDDEATKKKAK